MTKIRKSNFCILPVSASLLVALATLGACRLAVPTGTKPSYGQLNNKDHYSILDLRPGSRILVCGKVSQKIRMAGVDAVQTWGEMAARNALVVTEKESCADRTSFSASISLAIGGKECKGAMGYTSHDKTHHDVVFCMGADDQYKMESVILHEVGHTYSLCDQYDPWRSYVSFNANCKSPYHSAEAASSVMNRFDQMPFAITKDDRIGIRVLACIPGEVNREWLRLRKGEVAKWKTASFVAELKRLQAQKLPLLSECL